MNSREIALKITIDPTQRDRATVLLTKMCGSTVSSDVAFNPSALDALARFDVTQHLTSDGLSCGAQLSQAFLTPELLDALSEQLADPAPKRIRFDFNEAPALYSWPWELLPHPKEPGEFLALDPALTIFREIDSTQTNVRSHPPERTRPSVLFVCASPRDLTVLDFSAEIRALRNYAAVNGMDVTVIESATLAKVRKAARAEKPTVFYFSGHAAARSEGGLATTSFALLNASGLSEYVSWKKLQRALGTQAPIVVILNGCDSLGSAGQALMPSVVATIFGWGTRSVVGFRNRARVDVANTLAREFFRGFISSDPIDASVASARRRDHANNSGELHWANYILYSRNPEPPEGMVVAPREAHRVFSAFLLAEDTRYDGLAADLRAIIYLVAAALFGLAIFGIALAMWRESGANVRRGDFAGAGIIVVAGLGVLIAGLIGRDNVLSFVTTRISGLQLAVNRLAGLASDVVANRYHIGAISLIVQKMLVINAFYAAFRRRVREEIWRLSALLRGPPHG
jgi:hypothetical protein